MTKKINKAITGGLAALVAISVLAASAVTASAATDATFESLTNAPSSMDVTLPSVYNYTPATGSDMANKLLGFGGTTLYEDAAPGTYTKSFSLVGDEQAAAVWKLAAVQFAYYFKNANLDFQIYAVGTEKRDTNYITNSYSDYKWAKIFDSAKDTATGAAAIPVADKTVDAKSYLLAESNYTGKDLDITKSLGFPVARLDFVFTGSTVNSDKIDAWYDALTDFVGDYITLTNTIATMSNVSSGHQFASAAEITAVNTALSVLSSDLTAIAADTTGKYGLTATQLSAFNALAATTGTQLSGYTSVYTGLITARTSGGTFTGSAFTTTESTTIAGASSAISNLYNGIQSAMTTDLTANMTAITGSVNAKLNIVSMQREATASGYALATPEFQKATIANGGKTMRGVVGTLEAGKSVTYTQALNPEEATNEFWVKSITAKGGRLTFNLDDSTFDTFSFKVQLFLTTDIGSKLEVYSSVGNTNGKTAAEVEQFLGSANAKALELVITNTSSDTKSYALPVEAILYTAYASSYKAPAITTVAVTTTAPAATKVAVATPAVTKATTKVNATADANPKTGAAALTLVPLALAVAGVVATKKRK